VRGLDTNVLVRYFTQDDPVQARKATAMIHEIVDKGGRCLVNLIVLCELTWVLRGAYEFDKADLAMLLEKMLATSQFVLEEKDLVRDALEDYRWGPGDFADYVLSRVNRVAGCDRTATFDQRLKKSELFMVL